MKELTELERDALREVGYIGAGHASKALSELIGQRVDVGVPIATTAPLTQLPETLGGREELVVGVYLPVTGDLEGSVLLVFPQRSALTLADLLMKREVGTAKTLEDLDKSALMEVGNILAGHCLTAISKFLGIKLVEHIPDLARDMVGAVIGSVVVKFSQRAEQALVIVVELTTKEKVKIESYFYLLFGREESQAILKAVRAKVGE
ncbi:MAG: chemotaxis protein CheC [Candidatus Hadarchaeota archaeon]|nr:chemotaxis protein CheC [Candidatus Hadarchaeota archaeon]